MASVEAGAPTGNGEGQCLDEPVVRAGHVELAVVWVEKAAKGSARWVDDCSPAQLESYRRRKRTRLLARTVKALFLLLALFEQPSWCVAQRSTCPDMRSDMYATSLPRLPLQVSNTLEILCLLFFLQRLVLKRRALGAAFVFGSWQVFGTLVAAVALLDCVVAACNTYGIGPRTFRLARFCRPLVYIAFTKRLRQVAARVLWSVPKVVDVLISLAICMGAFVWVGVLLFARTDEGWEKFGSWSDAFASLWILFTTANFPDVMLPGFNQNRYAFLFFCAYLIISLFLLNNVLLAVMYNAYKDRWRASVKAV